jgi:hypothetical protein
MSRAEDIFQKLIYFGEDAIDEFIMSRQSEELFLDFKRGVSNGKIGGGYVSLHRDDRKNLAKCISGFGNSEGGVIVWGVDCARDNEIGDVAQAKFKVENVHRFLSWLENSISGCTLPSHNKVRNHIISIDENGNGYIATLIPKSELAPLMTTSNSKFYVRSGSNNVPAPMSVIAGMFGKKPQPNMELVIANKNFKVIDNTDKDGKIIVDYLPKKYSKISFSLRGQNSSNVIARELYMTCNNNKLGGPENKVKFNNYKAMENIIGVEGHLNLISKQDLRLPPRGLINFVNIDIVLYDKIEDDLLFEGVIGAENSLPKDFRLYIPKNQLRSLIAQALRADDNEEIENIKNELYSQFIITG